MAPRPLPTAVTPLLRSRRAVAGRSGQEEGTVGTFAENDASGSAGAKTADEAAFHAFFERNYAELARLAHLLTGEADAADDLAADALVAVWRHWPRVRAAAHPAAYARGVVANLARSRIRSAVRERRRVALFWSQRADRVDEPDVPAVLDLREALQRLPVPQARLRRPAARLRPVGEGHGRGAGHLASARSRARPRAGSRSWNACSRPARGPRPDAVPAAAVPAGADAPEPGRDVPADACDGPPAVPAGRPALPAGGPAAPGGLGDARRRGPGGARGSPGRRRERSRSGARRGRGRGGADTGGDESRDARSYADGTGSVMAELPERLREAAGAHRPDRERMLARVERGMAAPVVGERRAGAPGRERTTAPWLRVTAVAAAVAGAIGLGGLAVGAVTGNGSPAPGSVTASDGTRTSQPPPAASGSSATGAAGLRPAAALRRHRDGPPPPGRRARPRRVPVRRGPPPVRPPPPRAAAPVTATPPSGTPTARGGVASSGSLDPNSNPYWTESDVKITNSQPLTSLSVTLRIARTSGVSNNSSFTSATGISTTVTVEADYLVYRWTLNAGQSLPPGTYTFAGQFNHADGARDTSGDSYTVTASGAGGPATYDGRF